MSLLRKDELNNTFHALECFSSVAEREMKTLTSGTLTGRCRTQTSVLPLMSKGIESNLLLLYIRLFLSDVGFFFLIIIISVCLVVSRWLPSGHADAFRWCHDASVMLANIIELALAGDRITSVSSTSKLLHHYDFSTVCYLKHEFRSCIYVNQVVWQLTTIVTRSESGDYSS